MHPRDLPISIASAAFGRYSVEIGEDDKGRLCARRGDGVRMPVHVLMLDGKAWIAGMYVLTLCDAFAIDQNNFYADAQAVRAEQAG